MLFVNYYMDYLEPTKCIIVWDKNRTGNYADAELVTATGITPFKGAEACAPGRGPTRGTVCILSDLGSRDPGTSGFVERNGHESIVCKKKLLNPERRVMNKILEAVSDLSPEEALSQITEVLGRLLDDLDRDARERFMMNLLERSQGDKVSSLVNL